MSDPITIPLTDAHRAFFADLRSQERMIQTQRSVYASAIVAGVLDPKTLDVGGKIDVDGASLVITFASTES